MGICYSFMNAIDCFNETKCIDCDVPYHYYSNNEHRSRQSCRKSTNGYHQFPERLITE